jgi:hypothetical protein
MAPRTSLVIGVFTLQIVLLTIGISRDYRLKHEDNNALHATFARSHLHLGLSATRGQNYFYDPTRETGQFYANHPPGPGLVLAAVYGLTGHDGPLTTRVTAIAFHLVAAWLFYGLARRVLATRSEVLLAIVLFAILPESAFFGRMLNHEVLVLPAAILLVRGYWEFIDGTWPAGRSLTAIAAGAAWGAVSGWAGFFMIGACGLHAIWEVWGRRNARARVPLLLLFASGTLLLGLDLLHLLSVLGSDTAYLRDLLASRAGGLNAGDVGSWSGRIVELHWRYFGLTSAAGIGILAYRKAAGSLGSRVDPAVEAGSVFLVAGAAYVLVFSFNATAHDYWQFLLLPASVLGIVLIVRRITRGFGQTRRPLLTRVLLAAVILDLAAVTTVTLVMRHMKSEGYCLEVVERLRRTAL